MKKPIRIKSVLAALFLGVFLISCSPDDDNYYIDPDQIAGFMAINTVTDQESIGVSLSGVRVGQPLTYRAYTGGYLNIFPGERSTNSFSPYSGNTLTTLDFDYKKGNYYSLFITGREDDYDNIVVKDPLNDLEVRDSIAYVRYINAIPGADSTAINVSGKTASIFEDFAPYQEVSDFIPIKPQTVTVKVETGDETNVEREIQLEDRKVYTLLIVGDPESDEEWTEPQIRYIENGKLIKDPEGRQALHLQ